MKNSNQNKSKEFSQLFYMKRFKKQYQMFTPLHVLFKQKHKYKFDIIKKYIIVNKQNRK